VWATDIFAYYTGRSLGKTPLAPKISPNKTWEGSIGGAAAALLVAVGFHATVLPELSALDLAALTVFGGGVSQTGDLAESQIKRSTGTKDASSILPGHGGLFDRFDAMVVAAPLIYLYLRAATNLLG
jgi:phosphatidate cytidylyltransferase